MAQLFWPPQQGFPIQEERLRRQLQVTHPNLHSVHMAEAVIVLGQLDHQALGGLLGSPSAPLTFQNLEGYESFWVMPRVGTVSAWSSKATELVRSCGLGVERVEKVRVLLLSFREFLSDAHRQTLLPGLYDPLTESLFNSYADCLHSLEVLSDAKPLKVIRLLEEGISALERVNAELGLALEAAEIQTIAHFYQTIQRNPTDAELMVFAQSNSEHCRHKLFNARIILDQQPLPLTLFQMIKNTHQVHPEGTLTAYHDNGAVLEGSFCQQWVIDPSTYAYHFVDNASHVVIKVETHNHPTGISPFPGAATGAGGEIRDEVATGRGARSVAGLVGYSVSDLEIPGMIQPWEEQKGLSPHQASALQIMVEAPVGAASFQNEFGRPSLMGYFRTLDVSHHDRRWGYHKPVMLAGGMGHIAEEQVRKASVPVGACLMVLGGPGFAIGLGGGAASSSSGGSLTSELDFASVQRSNPEMQRCCQGVIEACIAQGSKNPLLSIHDVGAGGLANALSEMVHENKHGAEIDLRAIPIEDKSLSPLEILSNESQERYVLALLPEAVPAFLSLATRERCSCAVVGKVIEELVFRVVDPNSKQNPVELPMNFLFGGLLQKQCELSARSLPETKSLQLPTLLPMEECVQRILQLPAVADKSFLITIADRTVGGLVARDSMVGPWQVPLSDVGVTRSAFEAWTGEAMAVGERAPIALFSPAASARMALGEALTNIAAASVRGLSSVKLSANWMASTATPGELAGLVTAVEALGMHLCPELNISIPVGKDSLFMKSAWKTREGQAQEVVSPLTVVISAFAPVEDIRHTVTPELKTDQGDTELWFIDLSPHKTRLAGSALAQVSGNLYESTGWPEVDNPSLLKAFFEWIQSLVKAGKLLAYHDRSDGGFLVTAMEMMFASRVGVSLDVSEWGEAWQAGLFCEELGAVLQVRTQDVSEIQKLAQYWGVLGCRTAVAKLNGQDAFILSRHNQVIYEKDRVTLQRWWSKTSYELKALRDNPECAKQEYDRCLNSEDPGLRAVEVTFSLEERKEAPYVARAQKPKVAILRERGVNGHYELAYAWASVGFESVDVTMTDLLEKRFQLSEFVGLAAGGGFSYGDVLGAGRGWSGGILYHPELSEQFKRFFEDKQKFALGICNGCQMFSGLKSLIPGADHWPIWVKNRSEQFESRLVLVKVMPSPSLFFKDMTNAILPVPVAHGEGRMEGEVNRIRESGTVTLSFAEGSGHITERYPENPNGSMDGITGVCNQDGRIMMLMPHPERVTRTSQFSWYPEQWPEASPWQRLFANAREWIG